LGERAQHFAPTVDVTTLPASALARIDSLSFKAKHCPGAQ
jgi:hypothetical protein